MVGVTIIRSHLKKFMSSLSHSVTSSKDGIATEDGKILVNCLVRSFIKGILSSISSYLLEIKYNVKI